MCPYMASQSYHVPNMSQAQSKRNVTNKSFKDSLAIALSLEITTEGVIWVAKLKHLIGKLESFY